MTQKWDKKIKSLNDKTLAASKELRSIPNIGKAVSEDLLRLKILSKSQLAKQDPNKLYARLNKLDGVKHDICMLDTFMAAVDFCKGKPAKPWWYYSRQRKTEAKKNDHTQ